MELGRHIISKLSPLAARKPSTGKFVQEGGFRTCAASGILSVAGSTRAHLQHTTSSVGTLAFRRPNFGYGMKRLGLNYAPYACLSTSVITDSAKKVASFPCSSFHGSAGGHNVPPPTRHRAAFLHRDQLKYARRVVVKLGSAVITRADNCGLALGRLASIVEQCAELQNEDREMMIVTSRAVAFGKQKMQQELLMSLSMRETLSPKDPLRSEEGKSLLASRASAAVGQSGLMSLYEAMFAQYGVKVAQILITKPDFYSDETRRNLISTINELLALNIFPIINTNDAVSPPPELEEAAAKNLDIRDNDSLAARLAVEIDSDLMILMTNVDGIYSKPPGTEGAKLIDTCNEAVMEEIEFGTKSSVGTGGMESKVKAANYALDSGTGTVICNGLTTGAIKGIINGRKIGTFFTKEQEIGRAHV